MYEKNVSIKNDLNKIKNIFLNKKNAIDNAVKLIILNNETD